MSYQLLKTRLSPPVEAGYLLSRARLLDLSEQVAKHKLSILQAPAGFGKTSLMCQWYEILREAGALTSWLTIDSSGLDALDFFAYLGASLGKILPEYDEIIKPLIESRRYQTPEDMITTLVNLLVEADKPIQLFIDDLHFLPEESVQQFSRFLELAPSSLSLVVASRTQANLGLATARARGQLLEVDMEQLRFRLDETQQYIQDNGWHDIGDKSLDLLEERTAGWITGIKLANLALRSTDDKDAMLRDYSGSYQQVSDFFAEQVLSTQPEMVKRFLLKTSLLDRFCAGLCDHVLNIKQSRQVLDDIESAGLFLVGLDKERSWYRYHPLFRDFLQRRLGDMGYEGGVGVLLRASDWFREKDELIEAIDHAFYANKPARAAEILESCAQDWAYKGRIRLITKYVPRIPQEILQHYPTILLTWAWHLMRHLHFEQAKDLLDAVRSRVTDWDNIYTIPAVDLDQLKHQLLHREITLAAAQDDAPLVAEKCEILLSSSAKELHPYLLGSVYAQLLYANREQFHFEDIEALAAKARGVLDRSGYDFALIAVLSVIGTSLSSIGKTDIAMQSLEEGMKVAHLYGGERSSLMALSGLPLSAILYERNEIKKAEEILARHSANATDWGLVDQFVDGYITQARLHMVHGEEDEAFHVLNETMALALDRNLERLRLAVVVEQLRILSRSPGGSAQKMQQCARAAGIPASKDEVLPKINRNSKDELKAIAWVRVAMSGDEITQAVHVARNWRSFCEARGAQLSYVRWSILLAQALLLTEGSRSAQRILREAMAVAAPMGVIRSFLDEGAAVRTLLERCCQSESEATGAVDKFALQLLEAFGGTVPGIRKDEQEGIYGSLTDRELEVLQQVSMGMRNREVAERLGMTEGSIKWYMQQIFDKLGTRSRLQAVERARRLGFIS